MSRLPGHTVPIALLAASACAGGPDAPPPRGFPAIGSIERLDPAFDEIVPPDAALERVFPGVDGRHWSEGPVWVPALDAVLYSDIPSNTIFLHRGQESPAVWLTPSGYTGELGPGTGTGSNGLGLDPQGRLLLAQHGDRRVARLEAAWTDPVPRFTTLAAAFDGKRLNSPNDIAVRSNGDIYFTDPPYGLERGVDDPARELDFQGVYRLDAGGNLTLLVDDLSRPNGIVFSPDQRTLYVANSDGGMPVIRAYDVRQDGGLENGRTFFRSWGDGMTVDRHGNVYVAGPRNGVLVIAPDGRHLGSLLGDARTSNCAFSGDGSTLYITGVHVLRVRLSTTGAGF